MSGNLDIWGPKETQYKNGGKFEQGVEMREISIFAGPKKHKTKMAGNLSIEWKWRES
jgi:hypothetical protein